MCSRSHSSQLACECSRRVGALRTMAAAAVRLWPGCQVGLTLSAGDVVGIVVRSDAKIACVAVPAATAREAGCTVFRMITDESDGEVEVGFIKVSSENCTVDLTRFAKAPKLEGLRLGHLLQTGFYLEGQAPAGGEMFSADSGVEESNADIIRELRRQLARKERQPPVGGQAASSAAMLAPGQQNTSLASMPTWMPGAGLGEDDDEDEGESGLPAEWLKMGRAMEALWTSGQSAPGVTATSAIAPGAAEYWNGGCLFCYI